MNDGRLENEIMGRPTCGVGIQNGGYFKRIVGSQFEGKIWLSPLAIAVETHS